mmetsp:Transcript_96339/g.241545  ORF Transcript_96339/g.241545 Transcript_96339/m.241545 type:complete len:271 (+) Transcript_96339:4022-4834(+)
MGVRQAAVISHATHGLPRNRCLRQGDGLIAERKIRSRCLDCNVESCALHIIALGPSEHLILNLASEPWLFTLRKRDSGLEQSAIGIVGCGRGRIHCNLYWHDAVSSQPCKCFLQALDEGVPIVRAAVIKLFERHIIQDERHGNGAIHLREAHGLRDRSFYPSEGPNLLHLKTCRRHRRRCKGAQVPLTTLRHLTPLVLAEIHANRIGVLAEGEIISLVHFHVPCYLHGSPIESRYPESQTRFFAGPCLNLENEGTCAGLQDGLVSFGKAN